MTGRLKIFFGMVAGVGKTYTMLREARALLERGEDLAIGWVEPHGRSETDALLEGIERLPPRLVTYRGVQFSEMDLDAVIVRSPSLVLVDELAHSNAPGMRHEKRWEDVIELLDHGISVWTTINIQHLESWADSVELFTLVPVRERVPDSVFDRADEIQMVDIPPDELIQRLQEGKIYTGPASRDAVRNFFTKGNLGMLREIALRHASQLASQQLLETLRGEPPRGPSSTGQRILVAVSPSPNSQSLLRWARRLAYSIKAEWDCVYIESGIELSESDKTKLAENFTLARNLGAQVTRIPSADIAAGIIQFAESRMSSIIVVGKSGIPARRRLFSRPTLTERLLKESGSLPVFVVQERPTKEVLRKRAAKKIKASPAWQYAIAILTIAAVTAMNLLLAGYAGYWAASVTFLAAIILLALSLDRRPVLLAALLSALTWDYLFIPPRFTFLISKPEDILMLGLYFLVAATSGFMTSRLRTNERMLLLREERMGLIGKLSSELAGTMDLSAIIAKSVSSLERTFDAQAIVILEDPEGGLKEEPENGWTALDEKTLSAAEYCLTSGQSTGRYTSTLPVIQWHFMPMETPQGHEGRHRAQAWGRKGLGRRPRGPPQHHDPHDLPGRRAGTPLPEEYGQRPRPRVRAPGQAPSGFGLPRTQDPPDGHPGRGLRPPGQGDVPGCGYQDRPPRGDHGRGRQAGRHRGKPPLHEQARDRHHPPLPHRGRSPGPHRRRPGDGQGRARGPRDHGRIPRRGGSSAILRHRPDRTGPREPPAELGPLRRGGGENPGGHRGPDRCGRLFGSRQRPGSPPGRPGPPLRQVLPGRAGHPRRHGPRPGHLQGHRRRPRRLDLGEEPPRGRSGRGVHASRIPDCARVRGRSPMKRVLVIDDEAQIRRLLRISLERASLRRTRMDLREPVVDCGDLQVDLDARRVSLGDREVRLTPTEYAILSYLAKNRGKIVTQSQLLRELWGPLAAEEQGSLRVHISMLRKKLEKDTARPEYLKTEPGIGYRLCGPSRETEEGRGGDGP